MSSRFLPILISSLALVLPLSASAATKSGASSAKAAKSKSKSSHAANRRTRHMSSRLVPPPPAYMPSILPELYYRGPLAEEEEEEAADSETAPAKPKNPYAKYFYSRDNAVPKAVKARSGVTTWTSGSNVSGVTTWSR